MDRCECKCDCPRDWFLLSIKRNKRMCAPCIGAAPADSKHSQGT